MNEELWELNLLVGNIKENEFDDICDDIEAFLKEKGLACTFGIGCPQEDQGE